ncbi:hypothetical protein Csa_023863, partial [Cucumis sativus]
TSWFHTHFQHMITIELPIPTDKMNPWRACSRVELKKSTRTTKPLDSGNAMDGTASRN